MHADWTYIPREASKEHIPRGLKGYESQQQHLPRPSPCYQNLAKSSLLVTSRPKQAVSRLLRSQKTRVLCNVLCCQTLMFCFPFTMEECFLIHSQKLYQLFLRRSMPQKIISNFILTATPCLFWPYCIYTSMSDFIFFFLLLVFLLLSSLYFLSFCVSGFYVIFCDPYQSHRTQENMKN